MVQPEAGYEGVGVGRIAGAGGPGAHAARGLIQPDTHNAAADSSQAVGLTNETPAGHAHVVAASGTYHSTPTWHLSQRTVTDTYSRIPTASLMSGLSKPLSSLTSSQSSITNITRISPQCIVDSWISTASSVHVEHGTNPCAGTCQWVHHGS